MTNVPLLDLGPQNRALEAQFEAAFRDVLRSNMFIMGPRLEAFEKDCAAFLGVKHALGVSSGTDALLLALMALDIGEGDEVLLPSFTFFATAGSVARLGATPIWVDVNPHHFNIDLDDAARKVGPRTRAIMPVHLFGQSGDLDALQAFATKYRLRVIEDAAQSMGARWKGRSTMSSGDFGATSFFPSKNLGGMGDSGLVTTQDDALAARLDVVLNTICESLRAVAVLYNPLMPKAMSSLWQQLGADSALGPLADQRIADVARWGQLPPGTRVTKGDSLFPRIEEAS